MKTLTDLYKEYKLRHNGKPKHDFTHFIIVINKIKFHKEFIRPKIKWWNELN